MSQTRLTGTPVVRQFDSEWTDRYAAALIDLDDLGVATAGEWLTRLGAGAIEARDVLLLELLRKAQAGNVPAERTILKSLLPKLITHARYVFRRQHNWDDSTAVVMSTAWEVVHTFKTNRSSTRLRRNFGMEILHRLTQTEGLSADTPIADFQLEALIEESAPEQSPYVASTDPVESLIKVLTWAVDAGVVNRDDVAFIARTELGDKSLRELAEEEGQPYEAYRKRVLRSRNRLTDAIGKYMTRYISWE